MDTLTMDERMSRLEREWRAERDEVRRRTAMMDEARELAAHYRERAERAECEARRERMLHREWRERVAGAFADAALVAAARGQREGEQAVWTLALCIGADLERAILDDIDARDEARR